jgi:predicted Zn finger-like uncharacterized protein
MRGILHGFRSVNGQGLGSNEEHSRLVDSLMLIRCPTCATTYNVKPDSLGAVGRSVRCVQCRTVWFASARPVEPAMATGKRASMPHASRHDSKWPTMAAEESAVAVDHDPELAAQGAPALEHDESADDSMPDVVEDQATADQADAVVDLYPPITMADAPPLAPMDHDASLLPAEPLMPTAMARSVDAFIVRQMPSRPLPVPSLPVLIITFAVTLLGLIGLRASVVEAAPQMASLYRLFGLPVNLRHLEFDDVKSTQEAHEGVPVLTVQGGIANFGSAAVNVPRLRFAVVNAAGNEVYAWTAQPARDVIGPAETLPFRTLLASPPPDGRSVVVRFFTRRDEAGGQH